MTVKFANNATALLAGNITTSSTSLTLQSGGGLFPTVNSVAGDTSYVTVVDQSTGNLEIMKVTNHAAGSNTLTVQRIAGTPLAFTTDAIVENRVTAEALDLFLQADRAATFSANNTFSGANTFSGNNTLSGANTFSGNNNFSGTQPFAG